MEGATPDATPRAGDERPLPSGDGAAKAGRARAFPVADLVGFVAALGLASALGWSTTDLVWSLWLSSFVVGMFAGCVLLLEEDGPGDADLALLRKVWNFAGFAVVFALFHLVHSQYLAEILPLPPLEGASEHVRRGRLGQGPGPFLDYGRVFASYWPWLLLALFAERRAFAKARQASTEAVKQSAELPKKSEDSESGAHLFRPMANVVRMHLLIFVFLGLDKADLHGFWAYAFAYAIYFFPRRRA